MDILVRIALGRPALWVFIVFPLAGGLFGGLIYRFLIERKEVPVSG